MDSSAIVEFKLVHLLKLKWLTTRKALLTPIDLSFVTILEKEAGHVYQNGISRLSRSNLDQIYASAKKVQKEFGI